MWTALAIVLSAIIGVVTTVATNKSNEQNVEDANEANLESVRETNASNVEQANLAYQRSLPVNQVKNLMDAGFSRAGALSKLTGGGTYSAPVLQSGTSMAKQNDYSGIASAFERLSDIPSNVEQHKMVKLQRASLEQEMLLREQDEIRKRELHEFEVWNKTLGKEATTKLNSLASYIVSKAADLNINLDEIDSIDKLVKKFDLGNNVDWRTMPHIARNQVLQAVQTQHAENRARQTAEDAHRASDDAHISAQDKHEIDQQSIKKLKLEVQDFANESTARNKEYKARQVRATMQQMVDMYELNMNLQQALQVFEFDDDGNIKFGDNGLPIFKDEKTAGVNKQWSQVRMFWNAMFELFPVKLTADLFKGLLISPK